MRLDELTSPLAGRLLRGDGATEIDDIAFDSRRVRPGTLFVCVPGMSADGHEFAPAALAGGASALVVERELPLDAPQVLVADARRAMAPLAARLFGDPSDGMLVAAITGTNGKTTTAFLLRGALEAAGIRCGLLGTVKQVVGGREEPVVRTTPEAIDLQRTLRRMRDAGDRACVMEVSSHALQLGRADAIHFDVAAFTNLTQDHLDFHADMEDYYAAKRLLFIPTRRTGLPLRGAVIPTRRTGLPLRGAVIPTRRTGLPLRGAGDEPGAGLAPRAAAVNVDDRYGARLLAELAREGSPPATSFSPAGARADLRAEDVAFDASGTRFTLIRGDERVGVELPLPGHFNVDNALAALASAEALGVELKTAVASLASAEPVPGRMEPVDAGQPFGVLVDYAHTPDSLVNVLGAARRLAGGRLICVFGCGGDRDAGKRPQMGRAAAELSDLAVVTSDNPRSEDPAAIIGQILAGMESSAGGEVVVEPDRRAAIAAAVTAAAPGDLVVIAGKGHEQGQEFEGGRTIPFDDREVAREELARAMARA